MKLAFLAYSWSPDGRLDTYLGKLVETFKELGHNLDVYLGNEFAKEDGVIGLDPALSVPKLVDFIQKQDYDLVISVNNSLLIEPILDGLNCKVISYIVDDILHLFQYDKADVYKAFRYEIEVMLISSTIERQLITTIPDISDRLHFFPPATQIDAKTEKTIKLKSETFPISWIASFVDNSEAQGLAASSLQTNRFGKTFRLCLDSVINSGELVLSDTKVLSDVSSMLRSSNWTMNKFVLNLQNIATNHMRFEVLTRLNKYGLCLFGNNAWISTISCRPEIAQSFQPSRPIRQHHQLMDIYNSSLISINVPQSQAAGALQYRIMDIMASKSLLITQYSRNSDLFRAFGEDCPVPMYKTLEELEKLCSYFLENEIERLELVEKCNALVAAGQDFRDRCQDILRIGMAGKLLETNGVGSINYVNSEKFFSSKRKTSRISMKEVLRLYFRQFGFARKIYFSLKELSDIRFRRSLRIKFQVTKMSDYVKSNNIETILLAPFYHVELPRPSIIPEKKSHFMVSEHKRYDFPSVTLAKIKNATVTGHSNLISVKNKLIFHDCFDFKNDLIAEEKFSRIQITDDFSKVAMTRPSEKKEILPFAACFTDACSHNYSHWLTEVLPRIYAFCREGQKNEIPIIIDSPLPTSIKESLRLVAGAHRRVIFLDSDQSVFVKELSVVSPTGYIPFERRNRTMSGHSHGTFNGNLISSMINFIKSELPNSSDNFERVENRTSKRFFIRRNAAVRQLQNQEQIESMLIDMGFDILEPEKLTFARQVAVFSQADVIVGATGSAIANLLFCQPHSKFVVLIPNFPNTSYWYWEHMARAIGNSVNYVIGERADVSDPFDVHADFRVSPNSIKFLLENNSL